MNKTQAPSHLQPETQAWYREISDSFELESHHQRLLLLACECWDRTREARAILERDGLVSTDRYQQTKPHPAVAIEQQSRTQFLRTIRELNLDVTGPAEESRPPALRSVGGGRRRGA